MTKKTTQHEVSEPARPYRLWNANEKRKEPHRAYKSLNNAHNGATLVLRWAQAGTHLEVYDARTWRHLGTYSKRFKPGSGEATFMIEFSKGDGHVIVPVSQREEAAHA